MITYLETKEATEKSLVGCMRELMCRWYHCPILYQGVNLSTTASALSLTVLKPVQGECGGELGWSMILNR